MDKFKVYLQYLISSVFLIFILIYASNLFDSRFLQKFEFITYDWRVNSSLSEEKDQSVIMIDIDEKSIMEQGQWVWERKKIANLIDILFTKYNLGILGLDIVFSETEKNILLDNWQDYITKYPELENSTPPKSGDDYFAEVLSKHNVVLGYYFQKEFEEKKEKFPPIGKLPASVNLLFEDKEMEKRIVVPEPTRYSANLEKLQDAALGGGFFDNPALDSDGIFRRVPILQKFKGKYYPSLPMSMVWNMVGQPDVRPIIANSPVAPQLEGFDVGGFIIPTDKNGNVLVPYKGRQGHFPYYSATDILNGRVDPSELEGKMAILGSSAPGIMDLRVTPVASIFPGPEINLTLVAAMMQQDFRQEPAYAFAVELVFLLVIGLLMIFIFPRLNSIFILLTSILLTSAFVYAAFFLWDKGLVIPMTGTLFLLITQTLIHLSMNFWRESSHKKEIASQFGQYIPPNLVDDLVKKGKHLSLEGESKDMTVLFSDIRNFTAFSETCTPTTLTSVMNRLLTPITKAVHDNHGTIDKYMGDAVMAFWGAPLEDKDHPIHALEGAIAMQKALQATNIEFAAEGKPMLRMGVGIHTGIMNAGNMGSSFRMAYTVMGDNVNLGSRLESLTKFYGVEVLVSDSTADRVPSWIFLPVDLARVKGKQKPVELLTPIAPIKEIKLEDNETYENWASFIKIYRSGDFKKAYDMLDNQRVNSTLKTIYRERIEEYMRNPPENFDGVHSHTSK